MTLLERGGRGKETGGKGGKIWDEGEVKRGKPLVVGVQSDLRGEGSSGKKAVSGKEIQEKGTSVWGKKNDDEMTVKSLIALQGRSTKRSPRPEGKRSPRSGKRSVADGRGTALKGFEE